MNEALNDTRPLTKQQKLLTHVVAYYETGNEQHLDRAFAGLRPFLLSYLKSTLGVQCAEKREDIAQEALLKVLLALRERKFSIGHSGSTSLVAYAALTCKNHFIDSVRYKSKVPLTTPGAHEDPFLLLPAAAFGTQAEADAQATKQYAAYLLGEISQQVEAMPKKIAEVLMAYYFQGFKVEQGAAHIGMNVSSFKGNMRRGLLLIRKWAKKQGITSLPPELYDALSGVDTGLLFDDRPASKAAEKTFSKFTTSTTSQSLPAMTTAYVHPAPSPALHTLNTPELIDHDAAHPDSLATYARPDDVAEENSPLPDDAAHADFAFTPDGLPEPAPAPLPADGLAYESADYERFHLLPENRDIDFKHLRKLVALIGQKNMLHLKPIDVTPEGGIIDGQHRWAAARELGLPFFYRVGEQLTEADITSLNIAQKNWAGTDYLHYWTVKGSPSYVLLSAFRERHPRISFSNAKMMLSEPGLNAALDDFNAGRWVATNEAAAEQVAQLMERITDETGFKKTTHTRFVAALYRAVKTDGFDADRLLRKLSMQPSELRQQATDRQYLELLQRLYNYKTVKEDHLTFV